MEQKDEANKDNNGEDVIKAVYYIVLQDTVKHPWEFGSS